MARASTYTQLSLDRFAQVVGIHPLHFNQVSVPDLAAITICGSPYTQYSWQDADAVGREEIASAIKGAEEQIATELGFNLIPKWESDEAVILPLPANPELLSTSFLNVRGFWQSVQLKRGHIHSGGIEARTLISPGAVIAYTDTNADGYFDTATIVVATIVTDPEEIAIYYPGHNGENEWEIRPITVTIAAGVATIKCKREQLVLEVLLEALNPDGVNGTDNTKFLATVDVYRHYNDPSTQIYLIWEPLGGADCITGTLTIQDGFLITRNKELGIVSCVAGTWNSLTSQFTVDGFSLCRQPNRGRVYYRAGWQYGGLWTKMDPMWEKAVAYLALTMLDRPLCNCNKIESFVSYWREDFALSKSVGGTSYTWNKGGIINCPLGTTRGAIYAWRLIQQYRSN